MWEADKLDLLPFTEHRGSSCLKQQEQRNPMRALRPLNNELQRVPVTKYAVLSSDRRPLFQ